MVEEGKVSPDDAYDLMDAFIDFETSETANGASAGAPPPPPGEEKKAAEEPFKKFVDSFEKLTKETIGGVDWTKVASQVKTATKKGVEQLRESVDQISKGDFKMPWFGPSETRTVELPLHIETGKTLRLERTNGDIKIIGGEPVGSLRATVTVRGSDREDAQTKAEQWTPVIEENGNGLVLKQAENSLEEDLEIYVPKGVNLDIRIQHGDVSIRDTHGTLRVDSRSGDLDAADLTGSVEVISMAGDVRVRNAHDARVDIENKSGDILLHNIDGSISVRSSNGDVRLKDVAGSSIGVETVSGDVDLDMKEPVDGNVNLRTVSGDVLIDLASGSNARVMLASLSGSVSSRINLDDEQRTEERITGKVGTGEGTVDASAVSGDVRLSWREHQ
jgi:DUF4097 and DUF4098 domain-containing protein YvlB